jgi:hypothetical protein
MHLNDGQLRAYVDREIADTERHWMESHLAGCSACRDRLAETEARGALVGALWAGLASESVEGRAAQEALAKLRARRARASDKEMLDMRTLFSQRMRSVWVGLATLAALVVAFSFAPVRAWAGEMLGLFRVERVTVLPVDVTQFSQLTDDESLGEQMSRLFADSVKVTRKGGEPQVVADAAEASRLAGFTVRMPAEGTPKLVVQPGSAFEMVIDRAMAQGILNEAGRGDLVLPESLDGATIAVDIPTGVSAGYGDCPDPTQAEAAEGEGDPDEGERRFGPSNCILLAQVPSPTVETPPDVNIAELAEIGLQFTGMSAEEARAFSQTIDWTSTLVIPIPSRETAHRQVQVDGVTGSLIEMQSESGMWDHYTVIWVKDGIVYALTGFGDEAEGLQLANSLQ